MKHLHIFVTGIFMLSACADVSFAAHSCTDDRTEGIFEDNGTWTYIQVVDENKGSEYYEVPDNGGFGIYSWYNEDFDWKHNFADQNSSNANINILSAKMVISAWDVDSEPRHGLNGEYDGLKVNGVDLDPGLLQGTNNTTSITSFDLPLSVVPATTTEFFTVALDIDMNHESRYWATRLDYSCLEITYSIPAAINHPPEQPILSRGALPDLVINVAPTDPGNVNYPDGDGDTVTYAYRWFVDVGQGFYVDAEFAGKTIPDPQTNTIPATQTETGELWKVEVTPVDQKGAVGEKELLIWPAIGDQDGDGVVDSDDDYPTDPTRAFNSYYPSKTGSNTLAFEDQWPSAGDYDFNDLVITYRYTMVTDSDNKLKEVKFDGTMIARGAGYQNGFGISFPGLDAADIEVDSLSIDSIAYDSTFAPESGHSGELVYILVDNVTPYLPNFAGGLHYNTEDGDVRNGVDFSFSFSLTNPVASTIPGEAPFNPFLIQNLARNHEIHLPDKPPTDLADQTLFNTEDDASNSKKGQYYRTAGNLPWALNIPGHWFHPLESNDIVKAYLDIAAWANSGGSKYKDWYTLPTKGKIWPGK